MDRKKTAKKAVSIIVNILLYAFFAICMGALIFSIVAKREAGAVSIFGKQMRLVETDSMEYDENTDVSAFKIKSIPVNSLVFIDLVPEDEEKELEWYAALKVGDVLTFQYPDLAGSVPITHRIIEIRESGEGHFVITLSGDNTKGQHLGTQTIRTEESRTGLNYVIGRVTGQSKALGWIFHILKQPVGLVLIIIVPCSIIIIMQVIRIVNVLGADKKKKAAEENAQKESEIEQLKRQLSELQAAQGPPPDQAAEPTEPTEEPNDNEDHTEE